MGLVLSISELRFSYHTDREVLKGVTLSLEKGDILCLLGSNGVGKTTLLRCLLGFQKSSSGSIALNGSEISRMKANQRARHLAYVPQSSSLAFPYLAKEVVLMGRVSRLSGAAAHKREDINFAMECMEHLQVSRLADRRYQELSGGEKQMVLVARALAQDAHLLVMDEPTANLDYHNQVKILTAIKHLSEKGLSIFMTSHYPDHAFLACTKVALMKGGRITSFGNPDDVVSTESLTELYDTPVHVAHAETESLRIKTCVPLLDGSYFEKKRVQIDQLETQRER